MTSFEQHCDISYHLYLILKKFYMCNIFIWFQIVQSNYYVFAELIHKENPLLSINKNDDFLVKNERNKTQVNVLKFMNAP